MKRVRILIEGHVQGVFFRESMRRAAAELGVQGFVRNCVDGRVEVVLEGKERAVDDALEFVRVGPPLAQVHATEETEEPPSGEFRSFEIRSG